MAVLTRTRRAVAAALCAAAALGLCAPAAAQTGEQEIRAAFLYNFTKYVEWPPTVLKTADRFRMCIVADAAFVHVVESIVHGEAVAGRPLVVETPATPESATTCQLLYVSQAERERGPRLFAAVRDLPVLTVGDSPQFLERGGAIQFVLENRRVRFDISLPAAERSRLRVSSNLLRVARNIRQDETRQ